MIECCEITLPDAAAAVRLTPAAPETVVPFTCRNVLNRSFPGRAELKVLDERGAQVPTPPGFQVVNTKVEFEKGATQEIRCRLSAEGLKQQARFAVQLRVYNDLAPNEEFSEAPTVRVEYAPAAAERKPIPWKILAAVAGAVLLIAGVALALALRGPSDCQADAECAAGEKCGAAHTCLAAVGADCKDADACASGACSSGKCTGLVNVGVGGACGVGFVCPDKQLCDKSVNQCRGDLGFKGCSTNEECITGSCLAGTCGHLPPGATCDVKKAAEPATCPRNQRCTETVRLVNGGGGQVQVARAECLLLPKQACDRNEQCTSQYCNHGSCNRDDMKCDADGECLEGFKCLQKQCVIPLGSACMPSSAANVLCEGGLCSSQSKTCVPNNCGSLCGSGTVCINERCVPQGDRYAQPQFQLSASALNAQMVSAMLRARESATVTPTPAPPVSFVGSRPQVRVTRPGMPLQNVR